MALVLLLTQIGMHGDNGGTEVVLLPSPDAAPYIHANGIQASARIVGAKGYLVQAVGWPRTALPWLRHDADPLDLEPLEGDPALLELDADTYLQSLPYEINKDGVVVGFARYDGAPGYTPAHAAVWDEDGTFEDLYDDLESDLGGILFAGKACYLMDGGEIGGVAVVTSGAVVRPWVWSAKPGFTWVDTDGESMAAWNSGGGERLCSIVGRAIENWAGGTGTAAIWERGTAQGQTVWTLEKLPMPYGTTSVLAKDANASGRAVDVAMDASGRWYAWHAEKYKRARKATRLGTS